MRLGWTKNKNSTTYRAVKTVRVDGKNKTLPIKTFGSDKFICATYNVTDAKTWAKEQVRLMNEAEKEDTAVFILNFVPEQILSWVIRDVSMADIFSFKMFITNSVYTKSAGQYQAGIPLSMISTTYSPALSTPESFFHLQKEQL